MDTQRGGVGAQPLAPFTLTTDYRTTHDRKQFTNTTIPYRTFNHNAAVHCLQCSDNVKVNSYSQSFPHHPKRLTT